MGMMQSKQTLPKLARGVILCAGFALFLSGCGELDLMNVNFQAEAPGQEKKDDKPPKDKKLNNKLVEVLRNFVEEANDFEELDEESDDLLKSLDDADEALTRIKLEGLLALRNANRQVRTPQPAHSPNIVLIVAPRLGIGDLGAYGQTKIPTPHLDALAKAGVRLTDFYAGDPLPRASHWTLHTGLTSNRSKDDFLIDEGIYTLAETLWQGGYHTGFFGMWLAPDNATNEHSPLAHGYETWLGQFHAKDAATAYPKSLWINDKLAELPKTDDPVAVGDLIIQGMIEDLEHRPHRPFFLTIVLPPYLEIAGEFADEKLTDKTDWPREAQSYGAAVMMTDRDVGRIRSAIERLGLARTTSIYFTALAGPGEDHAKAADYFKSTGPYRTHESTLGEANLRVPFVAAFPGLFGPGYEVAGPAAMWDLIPTFTHLTKTQTHRRVFDGISFANSLTRGETIPPHLLYWETPGAKAQAVRLEHWKGLRPAGSDTLLLYDLSEDPGETKDVADQHPEVVEKLIKPPAS